MPRFQREPESSYLYKSAKINAPRSGVYDIFHFFGASTGSATGKMRSLSMSKRPHFFAVDNCRTPVILFVLLNRFFFVYSIIE